MDTEGIARRIKSRGREKAANDDMLDMKVRDIVRGGKSDGIASMFVVLQYLRSNFKDWKGSV